MGQGSRQTYRFVAKDDHRTTETKGRRSDAKYEGIVARQSDQVRSEEHSNGVGGGCDGGGGSGNGGSSSNRAQG